MNARVRRAPSLLFSLAIALAPFPAWGQTARVILPASGRVTAPAVPLLSTVLSPSPLLSPAPLLSALLAPSLGTPAVAPAPVVAAMPRAIPSAMAHAVLRAAPLAAPVVGDGLFRPAPPEFTGRSGAGLDQSFREHAAERGFEFGARAPAGAEGAGQAPLEAAGESRPKRSEPPAPAKAARKPLPLSTALWIILGNVAFIQFGVELMSLAVPQYALGVFGYAAMSAVSAASSVGMAAGSLLGSWGSDRFGPERTYLGALAARVAATTALAGLFAAGALPAAALVGLFALDFVMHSANYVALDTLAPRWMGGDTAKLNRFGMLRQISVDGTGVLGPLAAGLAIAFWGFGSVFWAYPALLAASAVSGYFALRGRSSAAPVPRAELTKSAGWKETFSAIARTPALRWSVLGYALITVVMMSLYFLAGPAFGAAAAAASGASAAQITSVMTGLFAGGGIIGALLLGRMTGRIEKAAAGVPAEGREAFMGRMLMRRMGMTLALMGAAILSFWALLGTAPLVTFSVFGTAVPIFAAQLLMLPLGAAWAAPTVGLMTVLQTQTADNAKAKAAGVNRFLAMFASFAFSLALGGLFSSLAGAAGFVAFAAIMTAFAVATAFVGWRLFLAGREPRK